MAVLLIKILIFFFNYSVVFTCSKKHFEAIEFMEQHILEKL